MSVSMETVNSLGLLSFGILCFCLGIIFIDVLELTFPFYVSYLFKRVTGLIGIGALAFLVLFSIIINQEREEE